MRIAARLKVFCDSDFRHRLLIELLAYCDGYFNSQLNFIVMNPTYLHLVLNHFPIIGTLAGIMLILFGIVKKSKVAVNIAATMFVVCALITIPVFLTGEPAEESVEGLPDVMEASIEAHEEAAQLSIWFIEALGLLSIITLFMNWKDKSLAQTVTFITFFVSLIAFFSVAYTGKLGGEIRHTEIVNGVGSAGDEQNEKQEDDD
jgi:uncharacterized membrane protein